MDGLNYQFIEKLKKLPFIRAIYIYGSRARGNYRQHSDIDIAIDCSGATQDDWLNILNIIEHADTLLSIDCIRYDTLKNSKLKRNIDRDKKAIYEKFYT